jgi:hypothetical protein
MAVKISNLEESSDIASGDLLAVYDVTSTNDYATEKLEAGFLRTLVQNPLVPLDPNFTFKSTVSAIDHYIQYPFESLFLVSSGAIEIYLPENPGIGDTYVFTLMNDTVSGTDDITINRSGTDVIYFQDSGAFAVHLHSYVGSTFLCVYVVAGAWLLLKLGQN